MSDNSALYEPLIERDLAAIPAAARAFAAEHSAEELWIAVARFAVLAYAPSQHCKRAVMACRAAHDVREQLGEGWLEMIVECARYAAASRQPWSEPPILEPPQVDELIDLHAAIGAKDRLATEHWLASHLDQAPEELRSLARGDALLMLDTAMALEQLLGEKGRYALLRMVVAEIVTETEDEDVTEPIEVLIDRAIAERGSIESVTRVFISLAGVPRGSSEFLGVPRRESPSSEELRGTEEPRNRIEPYPLARDYAQTLIAHSIAHKLPVRASEFLAAVHDNLEHGESFAEWSFA